MRLSFNVLRSPRLGDEIKTNFRTKRETKTIFHHSLKGFYLSDIISNLRVRLHQNANIRVFKVYNINKNAFF